MKRRDFVKYLEDNNCRLLREGSRHSIFKNHSNGLISSVPRHTEIDNFLAKKILKDLGMKK